MGQETLIDPRSRCARSQHGAASALFELGVFGLGGEQDGDVGVGVFPQGEESSLDTRCCTGISVNLGLTTY